MIILNILQELQDDLNFLVMPPKVMKCIVNWLVLGIFNQSQTHITHTHICRIDFAYYIITNKLRTTIPCLQFMFNFQLTNYANSLWTKVNTAPQPPKTCSRNLLDIKATTTNLWYIIQLWSPFDNLLQVKIVVVFILIHRKHFCKKKKVEMTTSPIGAPPAPVLCRGEGVEEEDKQ